MTKKFSEFKPGNKVQVTGYSVEDGVYVVTKYDPVDKSLLLDSNEWIWHTTRESASVELVDPKTEALERAFEATGELVDAADIREGDIFAKQYYDGLFTVYNDRQMAGNIVAKYRLVYRPEPVKVEAPTKLGAVVKLSGGTIVTYAGDWYHSTSGLNYTVEAVSSNITNGRATILFEGVDE